LMALAAGVVLPAREHRLALGRDARRLAALHEVQDAIEQHRRRTGAWPQVLGTTVGDGWDSSHDGEFLRELQPLQALDDETLAWITDERSHLRYRVFGPGSCACAAAGGFYVLALTAFETERFAARRPGGIACDHRDWQREFAHVRGGGIDGAGRPH
jgi:hypothetical protein